MDYKKGTNEMRGNALPKYLAILQLLVLQLASNSAVRCWSMLGLYGDIMTYHDEIFPVQLKKHLLAGVQISQLFECFIHLCAISTMHT